MIDRIKTISNPLTIIAIFAALAEVAGASTIFALGAELQAIFIWFVMGFPVLLVFLFFMTLNFNPRVLYAPSDFRDEENFLNALEGRKELAISFDELTEGLEGAKEKIIHELRQEVGATGATEKEEFESMISQQLEIIREKIETTRESVEDITSEPFGKHPHSALQAAVLDYLASAPGKVTLQEVAQAVGKNPDATRRAVGKLVRRGLIQKLEDDSLILPKP